MGLYEVVSIVISLCGLVHVCLFSTSTLALSHLAWDLGVVLVSCGFFCLSRALATKPFTYMGDKLVSAKHTGDERQRKLNKFSSCMYKATYFFFMCSWEIYLFTGEVWFPPLLGGSGSTKYMWTSGWSPSRSLRTLYFVNMGYHLMSTIFHCFIVARRADYGEFLFHHTLTLWLMTLAYVEGFVRPGLVILFLNDLPDFPLYIAKAFSETRLTVLCVGAYVCVLLLYGYCRLFVYPSAVLWSLHYESDSPFIYKLLLHCLMVLQIIWSGLLLKVGYHFAATGKTEDLQSRDLKKRS